MKLFNRINLDYKINPDENCIKYIKLHNETQFSKHDYHDSIVRGDYCSTLISIIFNTNSLKNTKETIKKFLKLTNNPEKIQFCIKIDNEDISQVKKFLDTLSKFNFNFVVLSSPKGRGFVDLWQWVNFLFKVSSKNSYFIMNISDEMCVEQKNWDTNLERYMRIEKDNIYRLRTSVYKNRNYHDLYECAYAPDTTAIYTRKYLTIQKNFSPCFGPDNGQQIVAYYLSKINYPRHYQYLRDIVINDISFLGQGTNKGLSQDNIIKRRNINHLLWLNIFKYKNQLKFYKRARKIQIEILKNSFPEIYVQDNGEMYEIYMKCYNEKLERDFTHLKLSYKNLSRIKITLYNLIRYDFFKYNTGAEKPILVGILVSIYYKLFNKFPIYRKEKNKNNSKLENLLIKYAKFTSNLPVLVRSLVQSKLTNLSKNSNSREFMNNNIFLKWINKSYILRILFFEIIDPIICAIFFYLSIIIMPFILIIDIKNIHTNFLSIEALFKRNFFYKLYLNEKYITKNAVIINDDKHDQSKTINIQGN